ncbi:MAG: radical SAM protein [Chloroflexi bacterium]|nr:radical SAM protein [Chloroflexota bacterium]MCL5273390.1 radical SAM protein [Chloroflexota bacterium]
MTLDKRNMYRLPWSMNDNAIAWLEVSDICNLACEGCYRQRITGHKTFEQVKEEVLFFKRWRNADNVSIAGGEPLIYPHILDLVALVKQNKMKPVILTNALALTPELLKELKKAGLAGFTIHIDSHQGRPQWRNKTEKETNELRQQCADMIAREKGLFVVFNATVYPSTYHEIPDILRWGQANIDKVHGLVFITYRTATTDTAVALDNTKRAVDFGKLSYVRDHFDEKFVTGPEVAQIIEETCPEYEASAYLGGTLNFDSFKWTAGATVGSRRKVYGSVGKRTMELAQAGHHLFTGTYLAYLSQAKIGRKVFAMAALDKTVGKAWRNYIGDVLRHPGHLFDSVYVQSIGIIQAPDVQPNGQADMCDSCPDMTYYDGKLINSCRMDEYRLFGGFLTVVDKDKISQPEPAIAADPSRN